jgi:hypothetical protein
MRRSHARVIKRHVLIGKLRPIYQDYADSYLSYGDVAHLHEVTEATARRIVKMFEFYTTTQQEEI